MKNIKVINRFEDRIPIMNRKKLSGLTKITEKNEKKVMGEINRFFKGHKVQQFVGYQKRIVGTERVVIEPATEYRPEEAYERNILSNELYATYVPYIGAYCTYHSARNEKSHVGTRTLLAIGSKFQMSCVPISVGDRYKIYGNRMVIMHCYMPFIYDTPYNRYEEFIYEDYTDEEELSVKINGMNSYIQYPVFDFRDFVREIYTMYDADEIIAKEERISDWIGDCIKDAMTNHAESYGEEYEHQFDHSLKLKVNPVFMLHPTMTNCDLVAYEVDGEKVDGIYNVLCKMVDKDEYEPKHAAYSCGEEEDFEWDGFDDMDDDYDCDDCEDETIEACKHEYIGYPEDNSPFDDDI